MAVGWSFSASFSSGLGSAFVVFRIFCSSSGSLIISSFLIVAMSCVSAPDSSFSCSATVPSLVVSSSFGSGSSSGMLGKPNSDLRGLRLAGRPESSLGFSIFLITVGVILVFIFGNFGIGFVLGVGLKYTIALFFAQDVVFSFGLKAFKHLLRKPKLKK